MPTYPNLRRNAFELAAPGEPWFEEFHTITFSQSWYENLDRLFNLDKPHLAKSLPVDQINRLMRATLPNVLAVRGGAKNSNVPWLYARHGPDQETLAAVMNSWVRTLRPEAGFARIERTVELVDALNLNWETASIDLAEQTRSAAGTAVPAALAYQLVPEVLAARITGLSPFKFRGQEIKFILAEADEGTTLVSWPPQSHHAGKTQWRYSAMIRIVVRTTPQRGAMRIHLSCGLRRWMSTPDLPLRYGTYAGAQLLITDPTNPLSSGRLLTTSITNRGKDSGLEWASRGPVEVLRVLSTDNAGLPSPADIVVDPQRWLRGAGGIAAGILYKTGRGSHAVQPGIMPVERAALTEWAAQAFAPHFVRLPDLVRSTRKRRPTNATKAVPKAADITSSLVDRRSSLKEALNGQLLEADVFWQQEKTRDALISALERVLGLPPSSGSSTDVLEWQCAELNIRLRTEQVGALCSEIALPEGVKGKRARIAAGVNARIKDVTAHFEATDSQTGHRARLVIIELAGEESFTAASDPKQAIRIGCAVAGRLTQFITLTGDNDPDLLKSLDERAESSWLDGFRQLGQRLHPKHSLGSAIPDDLQYIGLWLVKRDADAQLPRHRHHLIIVRTRRSGAHFLAEGWNDEDQAWLSYPNYLVWLSTRKYPAAETDRLRVSQQADVARTIKAMLYEARSTPTLLFVHGYNMRSYWPWLGNANIVPDQIQFGDGPAQPLTLYGPLLRIVRLMSNDRDETPEVYAPRDSPEDHGLSSGIWLEDGQPEDDRVFYSTTEKPSTGKSKSVKMTKIVARPQRPQDPAVQGWNPGLVEIFVQGCLSATALADADLPGEADVPEDWAALTHQLRRTADYRAPLKLPLPLHLAKLAGEYVLMHRR